MDYRSAGLGNNWRDAVKYGINEKREREFSDWLESIVFIDKDRNPLPIILTDDDSDDPENDREEADINL